VFVQDLPSGKVTDDALVAPFHIAPGVVVASYGVDPENPEDIPQLQKFVLDDGMDIPVVLPEAIPESARMRVTLEIPAVRPNLGFKAESDGYGIGTYQTMLVFASMLGII